MAVPYYQTFTLSTASLTGFASNVTGGTWVLTNTTVPDGYAHLVSLHNDSGTDHSGKTAIFAGIDQDGFAQSETIAMPGANATVSTTKYFKTLTSVTPSATIGADTMDIGYTNAFSSRTIPANRRGSQAFVAVIVGGTINYTVQYSPDDIENPNTTHPFNWLSDSGTSIVASTTSGAETFSSTPMAFRVITTSYSAGATLQLTISQMNENSL